MCIALAAKTPPRTLPAWRGRARVRGLTLIEVLMVLAIATMLVGGFAFASGQVARSRLRGSATRTAAAMRAAYQRAASTGRRLRLVVDLDERTLWLEETSDRMLVKTDDPLGTGGANAATELERRAEEEAKRMQAGVQSPRAAFTAVAGPAGQPQPLYAGIAVLGVDVPHESTVRTAGRAYVYFFGSTAERASVQLHVAGDADPTSAVSVVLAPLSGRASIVDGAAAILRPTNDAEASEADDDGR